MSHVTVSQAKPSAAALPAEAQQVTLEISDRLPGHTLYKYSMCTKDKPDTCSRGGGEGGSSGRRRSCHAVEYSAQTTVAACCVGPRKVMFERLVNI